MARTSALGHWLKSSKGKGKQRVASGDAHAVGKGGSQGCDVMGVKKVKRDGQIWTARAGIWTGALGLSVAVDLTGNPFVVKISFASRLILHLQARFSTGQYPSITSGLARSSQAWWLHRVLWCSPGTPGRTTLRRRTSRGGISR